MHGVHRLWDYRPREGFCTRRDCYLAYLQSDVWKKKRAQALTRADGKCEQCGDAQNLDVHHKTYIRVGGAELPRDLQVLCRSCHDTAHVTVDQRSTLIESLRRKDTS